MIMFILEFFFFFLFRSSLEVFGKFSYRFINWFEYVNVILMILEILIS